MNFIKIFFLLFTFITIDSFPIEGKVRFTNTLNIRKNPSIYSKVIGKLKEDDKVDVLEISNNFEKIGERTSLWFKIKINKNHGWIFGAFVELEIPVLECSNFPLIKQHRMIWLQNKIYNIKLYKNGLAEFSGGELGSLIPDFNGTWRIKNNKSVYLKLTSEANSSIQCYAGCAELDANTEFQNEKESKLFKKNCIRDCDKESIKQNGKLISYLDIEMKIIKSNNSLKNSMISINERGKWQSNYREILSFNEKVDCNSKVE